MLSMILKIFQSVLPLLVQAWFSNTSARKLKERQIVKLSNKNKRLSQKDASQRLQIADLEEQLIAMAEADAAKNDVNFD